MKEIADSLNTKTLVRKDSEEKKTNLKSYISSGV